jgi:hypothetical protein
LERRKTSLRLSCLCSDLILAVRTQKLENCVDCTVRTEFTVLSVIIEQEAVLAVGGHEVARRAVCLCPDAAEARKFRGALNEIDQW